MIPCPCRGCQDRTLDPNCHDAARCEKWAAFEEKKRQEREARKERAMLDNRNNLNMVKSKNNKGWTYVQGDVGGIEYARHKKQYLPAGTDKA